MRLRTTIALLLIFSVWTATVAYASTARPYRAALSDDARKLTPVETEEARALVMHFSERLQEKGDFAPLVDEMFISDYSQRLPLAPSGSLPFYFLDRSVFAAARRNELTRHYIAWMNFYYMAFRLYRAIAAAAEQSGESKERPDQEKAMPREVVDVLLSNPTLAPLALELREEADESAKERETNKSETNENSVPVESTKTEGEGSDQRKDTEDDFIKTADEMNGVSATLETAVELMRKRLEALRQVPKENDDAGDKEDSLSFDVTTLDEGEYGYAEGTETIHVDLAPFCINLIKADGQLKILTVVVYVD